MERLILDTELDEEVTTYVLQAYFPFGKKPGETPYQKWSYCESTRSNDIEDVKESLENYIEDGIEARIVKIVTKADIL